MKKNHPDLRRGFQAPPILIRLCLILWLLRVPVWGQSPIGGSLTVQLGTGGTPPLSLVSHGDLWRYRKGTSAPPAGWRTNADATLDGSWLNGPGGFGYGDNDDGTVLSDMQNSYTTVYIRKSFDVGTGIDTNRHLRLVMDFDDGFVAWLDGAELARTNAPGTTGTEPAFNATATAGHEASSGDAASNPNPPATYDLGAIGPRLTAGTHILAIEGLNQATNSSDLSLIADLSVAGDDPGIGGGVFFAIVNTNSVFLSGSNSVSGSTRVVVNGEEAQFSALQRTWSKTQTLSPGFNRLVVEALDAVGAVLASTNQDIVVELSSSHVGGAQASAVDWDSSMGIIHVTNNVVLPAGGALSIAPGTVLLFNPGASVLATNASIIVSGTATNPVYFLPADGTTVWGGLIAAGTNGNLMLHHAETIAGHVEVLEGATGLVEDSYLHDYLLNSPAIVHALRAASLTLRRNHVQRYYEHLIQLTPVVIEDCLVENITGDGIDFDGAPPGSVIRRCTVRHGDITNVDGLDMGNFTDGTPSRGVVIEDCLIYDFTFDKGVSIGEAAQNITVRNCVIYQVQSGVAVKDSSIATIYNNTIVDSEYGLHLYEKIAGQGGGHATAYNNIIWGVGTNAVLDSLSTVTNSYSDISGTGIYPGTGNINADPRFVNAAARDYHLLPNSPCIDTGDPAAPHDPDGTRADMGAYAFDLSYLLPVIVTQPQNYTVAIGCDATFKVVATSPLPLSYQWRRNVSDIPGATNDTFVVQRVNIGLSGGQYSVVVSNAVSSVASSNAVLTVSADVTPPVITAQPESQTITAGSNVTFTVEAVQPGCLGSEGLTYQWLFNATNVIDGATNSSLVLTNVQPSVAGAYSVRVRDASLNLTDSQSATLTVLVKPTITLQPVSQTVAPGATVMFIVQAEGTPPLNYQWRAGWVPGDIPGETNDTLVVSNAQANVAGNYRVIVSNAAGSTQSAIAVLSVVPPPSLFNATLIGMTNFSFSFVSAPNQAYAVEYKDTLTDPAWLTLRIVNGDGGALTITDSMTNLPSRFYRIRVP